MSFTLRAVLGLDGSLFESMLLHEEQVAKSSGKRIAESLRGGDGGGPASLSWLKPKRKP